MLCQQCATAAKVVWAMLKMMTTPNAQQQDCLEWWWSLFFFKVRQEFIQEFACSQLSFSVFWVAPTWKHLHQKIKTQSQIHLLYHFDHFDSHASQALVFCRKSVLVTCHQGLCQIDPMCDKAKIPKFSPDFGRFSRYLHFSASCGLWPPWFTTKCIKNCPFRPYSVENFTWSRSLAICVELIQRVTVTGKCRIDRNGTVLCFTLFPCEGWHQETHNNMARMLWSLCTFGGDRVGYRSISQNAWHWPSRIVIIDCDTRERAKAARASQIRKGM